MSISFFLGLSVLMCLQGAALAAGIVSWGEMLDCAKKNEALAPYCERLVSQAREAADKPIVKRAGTLAEVGRNRTWLDGRSKALEDEIRETFALAMSDFAACNMLSDELPLLAAAYRLTGEESFRDRVVTQLTEIASWSPLQRPGWTLYHPGARLPSDGEDGNWLATGCGVRAIGDTLELMPEGSIDGALRLRLDELLEGEIAGVVDDWEKKRPWFVRGNNPITNQWVLPTEGLVRACLILGVEDRQAAYELGVRNLLQALDAHGPAGEFEEGFGYASFTVTSMLHAARAMAANGDRRAIDHPFLRNFPTWLVHHFQPGDMIINCFDCFDAGAAKGAANGSRPLLSMLAACTASPVARWALAYQTDGPPDTLAGLVARALPPVGEDAAPPLFAAYERAARVNWRDNWNADGTGVWVRGGHPLDQHDHRDRGHVNFISKGRAILIEAGTPSYSHPRMGSHFASGVGHNILQLGTVGPSVVDAGETQALDGWQKPGVVAPIMVRKLDANGGDVTVAVTSGYDGLDAWRRNVSWDAEKLTVRDTVKLVEGQSNVILFRWHLGTNEEVSIANDASKTKLTWADATMTLEGTARLVVSQIKMPDNTVNTARDDDPPDAGHTCIVVRSEGPLAELTLSTEVFGS